MQKNGSANHSDTKTNDPSITLEGTSETESNPINVERQNFRNLFHNAARVEIRKVGNPITRRRASESTELVGNPVCTSG